MNSFVCSQITAIGLFVTLFAYAASEDTVYFSTKPKDKEVFVGKDVQFDWEYVVEDVEDVRFGVVVENNNVAILVKTENGTIQNNVYQSVEWIRDRVEIVPGKRASFIIRNVVLEDSTTFFCQVRYGIGKTESDRVKLSVVDLLIDESASDTSEESWLNHKITVVCAVKIPEGHKATFSWMHIPSNKTVDKGLHDDTGRKSYLTMITKQDVEFETLQCRAENRATVKYHKIDIKKLSPPSSPRNLKTQRRFNQKSAEIYIQLKWERPSTDGGTEIKQYIVQYVAEGLPWKSPNTAKTTSTVYNGLRLPNGKYNARVRAQNKAGQGPPSNEVLIDLEDFEPSQLPISGSSNMHCLEISLLMLSVLVWFL